ncbi:MAG: stage II sporulation protein M, partial [Lachnospiraceae bacterium]|nr:stage II sporulation protein M [Lachnospiraceae bacterium]
MGIIKANFDLITMNGASINELGQDINNAFHIVGNNTIQKEGMIFSEFINIAKLLMIVWVCGSSIMGIPAIFYIVYTKGYMLGVCSGILIKSMGINGITLITVGILPKEIFFIPIIIILGVNGIKFS